MTAQMRRLQEAVYGEGADYRHGSPHLTHWSLFDRLVDLVRDEVRRLDRTGADLDVLEIGAGHGGYTEAVLAAGCAVTAVEMSGPALDRLVERFGTNDRFRALLDPDGSLSTVDGGHSLVLAVSVLHHIPDYLSFLDTAADRLRPGGTLVALQDPMWFPRAARPQRVLDKGAFYAWRLGQGDLRRGFGTLSRRLRGVWEDDNPSDMVEYHAVRDGVDELAVADRLRARFEEVRLVPYWSHVAPVAQRLGERLGAANTFGVVATGRLR
jgi:SAM-dependent methyltransferase